MTENIEKQMLNIMEINESEKNRFLIKEVLKQVNNDIDYLLPKLHTLKRKIEHVKGYITISNSSKHIKVSYDKDSVSKEVEEEFHEICNKWVDKYKIKVEFDYAKGNLYIA